MKSQKTSPRLSLPVQILLAVIAGISLGVLFPDSQLKPLSEIGKLIIHWVKLVAGPFLFLTVVAAVVQVRLTMGHGLRVVLIALLNTSIAIFIGMGLAKVFLADVQIDGFGLVPSDAGAAVSSLSFSTWLKTFMPSSLIAPFVNNEILLIALMALATGLALRKIGQDRDDSFFKGLADQCERWRSLPGVWLQWLIALIPLAVATVVAGSVSEYGLSIFGALFRYVGVVILGFTLQVVLVYGAWILLVARRRPQEFWHHAKAPILYAFGVNSSLATLPLTLKALKGLGVSERSASLGAGVATNLNNDGIVLYEAMAVYFVAQLNHVEWSQAQMLVAALSCIVASMGITGIPEAGFISLSVVVSTMGLPAEALPLLLSVDWMIARLRSVVNVISDMTLSIAMDATERS
jgi:Na+/H+-dicarboxylate symporter